MFNAIKDFNKMIPKTHLLIKEGYQYIAKNVKLIAEHFQKQFNKDRPLLAEISAAPMKTPFTSGETQAAIKQLHNKKKMLEE